MTEPGLVSKSLRKGDTLIDIMSKTFSGTYRKFVSLWIRVSWTPERNTEFSDPKIKSSRAAGNSMQSFQSGSMGGTLRC
ncbi:MAG: hypothetical protein AAF402_06675 [Pseudomonadota bacterium]